MEQPVITSVEDIAKLPWVGCHGLDYLNFEAVDAFVATLSDREEQKEALHLMAVHGMGWNPNDRPTDVDLDCYLEEVVQYKADVKAGANGMWGKCDPNPDVAPTVGCGCGSCRSKFHVGQI